MSVQASSPPKLVDIGSNLGDPVFQGRYHGKRAHEDDWDAVMTRARRAGVTTQILTGDCLSGSRAVLELADRENGAGLYTTAGCHPCRAQDFDKHPGGPDAYLEELAALIERNKGGRNGKGKIVAVGEVGLDFDRLMLCPKDVQLKYFPKQLELASRFDLPLFLHSRNAHKELVDILRAHRTPLRGVVHSHSGTLEEALEYIAMGFYVGINGCSMKTPENVACVKALPLSKLMLESDCPYCEVRPSHASFPLLGSLSASPFKELYDPPSVKKERWAPGKAVKGRNEPACTGQIAFILAQLHGISLEEVAAATTRNATELFGLPSDEQSCCATD